MAGNQGSGVSRFVTGKHEPDHPTQTNPTRARLAFQHRVPTNDKALQQAKLNSQLPNNSISPPAYEREDEYRDNFIPEGYEDDQRGDARPHSPRDGFDDGNTLNSAEIDSTVTINLPFDGRMHDDWNTDDEPGSSGPDEEYDIGNGDDFRDDEAYRHQNQQYNRDGKYLGPVYPVQQEQPRRQSPMIPILVGDPVHVKPTHGSRFQNPTPREHTTMVNRPIQNGNGSHQGGGSKKRSRGQQHEIHQEYNEQPLPKVESDRRKQEQHTQPNGQLRNDILHIQCSEEQSSDKGPDEDYEDDQLKAMSFEDLKKEAFEHNPRAAAEDQNSAELDQPASQPKSQTEGQPEPTDLEGSWNKCMKSGPEEQEEYYSKLSMSEWEETGDLFIVRFSGLMQKLREARTNRRAIIAAGEREIELREEMIRGKSASYDDELKGMRRDGESVLRGKLLSPSTPRQAARKA